MSVLVLLRAEWFPSMPVHSRHTSNKHVPLLIRMRDTHGVRVYVLTQISAQLLYRATRDGLNAAAFHRRCGDKRSTLTLIKVPIKFNANTYTYAYIHTHSDIYMHTRILSLNLPHI